jgi:hypothetical protein
MPYDTRMPIAPGRAYALRMPGGPTGGPYGEKSRTIWNDEFIATEIGQIGTQMDALGHLGCMCGAKGDKTNMLFYNGNKLSDMWSPYGLKKLGMENAPPFFTRGVLFDVQGLKGRVLDVGEEIQLADLKACLERQGISEDIIRPGDAVFVRTGHGSRWYTETATFYDGAPGIGLDCAAGRSGGLPSLPPAPDHGERHPPPRRHDLRGPGRAAGLGVRLYLRAAEDRRRDRLAGQSDRGPVAAPAHGPGEATGRSAATRFEKFVAMLRAARSAMALIVLVGLTAAQVGMELPSTT